MGDNDRHRDVDKLLKRLFHENERIKIFPLKELFEQRLDDLSITKHQACKILGVENKTLDAFLSGDSKKVDFISILKLSDFLEVSHTELMDKYFDLVLDTHNQSIESAKKRSFIVNNFDLPQLKKIGLIDSINDFDEIERSINVFFGYDSIFEHGEHKITAVFSSGKRKTNHKSLEFWFAAVRKSLDKTPNPHEYDRDGLIDFFPKIRWHCMDIENGLLSVAQKLFRLGITLIIVPKFTPDLHIRGATFSYGDKPCVALTKYTQFYPTLWFALIHELFHVLYDWDVIKREKYHFTKEAVPEEGEGSINIGGSVHVGDLMEINEQEADDFARQYLFPNEKMKEIAPHINEPKYVERFARLNHVDPSFIYVFYLWENESKKLYGKFNKYFPKKQYERLLNNFSVDEYLQFEPVKDISRKRNINLNYNTL
ncbi:MAG: hypothetical protein NXH90_15540 [Flavobacteriaceae bacterium]|nr:hypothetical protein [Flavobacteriaceae bacterium]